MQDNKIQEEVLNKYINNMNYLEKNHTELFKRIKLFETAIELEQWEERYVLEYKDDYFDIYDAKEEKWIYNCNSVLYSKKIAKEISFQPEKNSFKTFYDVKFGENINNIEYPASIMNTNPLLTNAKIIDYVNRNLPEYEMYKDIDTYIIFGVGLGIHIGEVDNKVHSKVYFIIEPSLELFRLSLFVTDYIKISSSSILYFSIAEDEEKFTNYFNTFYESTFFYNHYIPFFLFSSNCNNYIQNIQNYLVSQSHLLYSYNRELLTLYRTMKNLKKDYSYINISRHLSFEFTKKPILLLAAGPSLQKNIKFVRGNQDKYIIVAIYVTLPLLEKYGIVPDIVTHYDEFEGGINTPLKEIENIDFLKNTLFIVSSKVDDIFFNTHIKDNIFVFQSMFELKKDFGILTSPSIGEITYALLLIFGAKNISLLGLDMALDEETGKSHIDSHKIGTGTSSNEKSSLEKHDFRKSKIKIKGNFINEVETLPIFQISIRHINYFSKKFYSEERKVYNLSNGAYFEHTIPLQVEEITRQEETFLYESKTEFIKKELLTISENKLSQEDILHINIRIKGAEKLLILLTNHNRIKYLNLIDYQNKLFELFDHLFYKDYQCKELQQILLNYAKYNVPYLFYLFNQKNLTNPKTHIKKLNKELCLKLEKIIKEYIDILT